MLEFLSIVMLVFGILQIILFFKVWGMTNDVKKIKNHVAATESDFDLYMILDEQQKALELVKVEIANILEGYKNPGYETNREAFLKWADRSPTLKEAYRKAELTGIGLPPQLKTAEAFWDFCETLSPNKTKSKRK